MNLIWLRVKPVPWETQRLLMVSTCIQLGFINLGSMLLCQAYNGAGMGGNPEPGR